MRKIFAIGETLLDIIFRDDQPQTSRPGGSMLNSIVSMGRIGLPVYFISEYGDDHTGDIVDNFLSENGVETGYVNRYRGATSLALAFLDEKNDAHYTFYKNHPDKQDDLNFPEIEKEDIILFGSYYSVWPRIRKVLTEFITMARERGALIVYDPNFRKSHLNELPELKPMIISNMKMASVVRGSDEDFKNIFGAKTADEAYAEVRKYCPVMICTANTRGVFLRTGSFEGTFPVRRIDPVSTIGAGDNFNAGMISSLYIQQIGVDDLPGLGEKQWQKIVSTAVDFATDVCLSYDNYISPEFAESFRSSLHFRAGTFLLRGSR
jgi:fructokinase